MIRVNDDYVIAIGPYDYTAQMDVHKTNKEGEPIYKTIGYYPNTESALKAIVKDMIRTKLSNGTHNLEEAIRIIKECNSQFDDLLIRAIEG